MSTTLSPCTLLSRSPPPPGKISFSRARMQPDKQAAAALPRLQRKQSRALLFVCHAKHTYDIQPFALLHPKFPPTTSPDNWTITEDEDRINLWLFVEEKNKNKLEVATQAAEGSPTQDKILLIRYTGDSMDSPASNLDVRLLMPHGYDKVEAELAFGSLLVTVTKPKHDKKPIDILLKP